MRTIWSSAAVIGLTLAGFTTTASAATITLDATSRGWYNQNGQALSTFHGAPTANYAAGQSDNSGTLMQLRNFFIFDLPSLTETIVSATLRLTPRGYVSPDPSETYELYDVTTPLASLTDRSGGLAAYTDLGSGTSYGSRVFTLADAGTVPVTIALNAAALANLQAAAGARIGLGGALTTLGSGIADQYLFPVTDGRDSISQLVLETAPVTDPPAAVPEPASLALLGAGLVVLASRVRRMQG